MNFDITTGVLIGCALLLGIAYFMRRSARIKRQQRKL